MNGSAVKVGFTGTRQDMTVEQHRSLIQWIRVTNVVEFHHGCCIGSDRDAVDVVLALRDGPAETKIVAHPPANKRLMSESALILSDERRSAKPYLERNQHIVDETDVLVATPKGDEEETRSGTWSTIRYARRQRKPVIIINPSGLIEIERTSQTIANG